MQNREHRALRNAARADALRGHTPATEVSGADGRPDAFALRVYQNAYYRARPLPTMFDAVLADIAADKAAEAAANAARLDAELAELAKILIATESGR